MLAAAPPYAIVSSDLVRALATAQAVGTRCGVPVTADERLREISLGSWEGLTGDEARERYPDEHASWVAGEDARRGGGETYREAAARAVACIRAAVEAVPASEALLVVTHGGTARGALGELLGLDPAEWWRFAPLGNTCWSVLVEGQRGWRLERHNAALGPLVGAATGAHDLGARPVGSPDVEPVK